MAWDFSTDPQFEQHAVHRDSVARRILRCDQPPPRGVASRRQFAEVLATGTAND